MNQLLQYKYRTSQVRASHKKLLEYTKHIKGMLIDKAIIFTKFITRKYRFSIIKDLNNIRSNLLNVIQIDENLVEQAFIRKVHIEKKAFIKKLRYAAKGRGSRSHTAHSVLCLFIEIRRKQTQEQEQEKISINNTQ